MKKSTHITLTLVTAMAISAQGQTPPVAPNRTAPDCGTPQQAGQQKPAGCTNQQATYGGFGRHHVAHHAGG